MVILIGSIFDVVDFLGAEFKNEFKNQTATKIGAKKICSKNKNKMNENESSFH